MSPLMWLFVGAAWTVACSFILCFVSISKRLPPTQSRRVGGFYQLPEEKRKTG
jgi:hypothetical protein